MLQVAKEITEEEFQTKYSKLWWFFPCHRSKLTNL